ncbi:CMT1A duplicated region transcript 4 protein [Pezoporus wallicus]|uniref:CMT1A duplicated region transcript 4 protein n=1 Tax=Pezoporus wallicus TaxID=35540 RepID=UPI00254A813B|nr:CMT1A duplicated region transcript 4 protein [Pezoporus wallicus]
MDAFLKDILEPSEQDVFNSLTRMETPSINTFRNPCAEHEMPSANLGLPSHLIQHRWPQPAYVTHTAPMVKMLFEQDEWRRGSCSSSGETDTIGEPGETGSEEETQVPSKLRRGSILRAGRGSVQTLMPESSLPLTGGCHRVIFARKPPPCVLPSSSLASSSKKK